MPLLLGPGLNTTEPDGSSSAAGASTTATSIAAAAAAGGLRNSGNATRRVLADSGGKGGDGGVRPGGGTDDSGGGVGPLEGDEVMMSGVVVGRMLFARCLAPCLLFIYMFFSDGHSVCVRLRDVCRFALATEGPHHPKGRKRRCLAQA